jgi:hypothetical protein
MVLMVEVLGILIYSKTQETVVGDDRPEIGNARFKNDLSHWKAPSATAAPIYRCGVTQSNPAVRALVNATIRDCAPVLLIRTRRYARVYVIEQRRPVRALAPTSAETEIPRRQARLVTSSSVTV